MARNSEELKYVRRMMPPQNESVNTIKYGGIILFILTVGTNGLNYIFQVMMGRMLTLEDFGIMNALFSMIMIASMPIGVVSTTTAKYIATYNANGQFDKINKFLKKIVWYILFGVVGVLIIGTLISPQISRYMNINSSMMSVLLAVVVSSSMLMPLINGALQGTKRFFRLGLLGFGTAAVKLVVGVAVVMLGLQLFGIMNVLIVDNIIITLIGFYMIKPLLRRNVQIDAEELTLGRMDIARYAFIAFIINLCIALLSNVDMVFIKRFFSEEQAGYYGIAALFGRLILYIPNALVMAMFPIAAELEALEETSVTIIKKTLFYVGGVSVICAIGLNLFTDFTVQILMGEKFLPAVPYVRLAALLAVPVGLMITLANYCLAIQKMRILSISMAIGCISCIIVIEMIHTSIPVIVLIIATTATLLFIFNLIFCIKPTKK